jgi:hypothetical protein
MKRKKIKDYDIDFLGEANTFDLDHRYNTEWLWLLMMLVWASMYVIYMRNFDVLQAEIQAEQEIINFIDNICR